MVEQLTIVILSLSVILQFSAAYFALYLVKVTNSRGWLLLSIALFFMGLRRLISLIGISYNGGEILTGILPEIVALIISVLMVTGVFYISGYFRSKTEADRALKESEKRYRTLVETMNESVITLDRSGRITYANSRAAELFGTNSSELIGKPIVNYCSEECSWQLMQGVCNPQKVPITIETHIVDVNGEKKDVLVSISPVFDDNSEFIGTIAALTDITPLKKTEEKLRDYAEKLKQSSELKDLFIDILHHDLMNYVSIIKGHTEIAKSEGMDRETIKIVRRNADRIMEVIEDATKYSKIASMDKIEKVELDLAEVIASVVQEFGPVLSEIGMRVENRIDCTLPMKANPVIEEIFLNFLTNAIKYARGGKEIVIYAEDTGDCWKINFADFGPGVPEDQRSAIFQRFSRGLKGEAKGSGLGLAIAKRVAELHGGEVGVEDNTPKGSIFWAKLPKGE
ncbi:PAS domain-containing sensor histidine kinase [Candidatus Pyrohabitans sp.]